MNNRIATVPPNNPEYPFNSINCDPIKGPNKNPNENMERNTVFANFARSRELEILIDSLAEAYNCGIAGANKP